MITITKEFKFEAAHYLPDHPGLCKNLHGHSYKMKITVRHKNNKYNNQTKMVVDFGLLKSIVNKIIIDKVDHSYLNKFFNIPTAEFMVERFADILQKAILKEGVDIVLLKVSLWETAGSEATWTL